jgi:hypothetical protein
MTRHAAATDPPLLAVTALDDFVADIVRQAHADGVQIPPAFFDWALEEGTRLVERLVERRQMRSVAGRGAELATALRCGVRYWVSPWVVARFPELRPLFPELSVQSTAAELSVLVRVGRWRCANAMECAWRLCEWSP